MPRAREQRRKASPLPAGQLVSYEPPARSMQPHVAARVFRDREHIYRACAHRLRYVMRPEYADAAAERLYACDWRAIKPTAAGLGPHERAAFLWLHYARYRLHLALAATEGRPFGLRLAREVGRWARETEEVLQFILDANRRLVRSLAGFGDWRHADYEDRLSDATVGLIRAAECFDPARGFRFSTYAVRTIRSELASAYTRLAKCRRGVVCEYDPAFQLADAAGRDDWHAERAECRLDLAALLPSALLSAREREVLSLRYGLDGDGPLTLDAIGERIGVSKERVRQIQKQALTKCRAAQR